MLYCQRYIAAYCDSVDVMDDSHKWMNVSEEEAVGKSLRAGIFPMYSIIVLVLASNINHYLDL